MAKLDGKIAWVTGAGSGIGEAAADRARGARARRVVLTGRRREPLEAVAKRIGAAATVEQGDVTEPRACRRSPTAIKSQFGRLDILVSNAGLNVAAARLVEPHRRAAPTR